MCSAIGLTRQTGFVGKWALKKESKLADDGTLQQVEEKL